MSENVLRADKEGREYGRTYGQGRIWAGISQTEKEGTNHSRSRGKCGPLKGNSFLFLTFNIVKQWGLVHFLSFPAKPRGRDCFVFPTFTLWWPRYKGICCIRLETSHCPYFSRSWQTWHPLMSVHRKSLTSSVLWDVATKRWAHLKLPLQFPRYLLPRRPRGIYITLAKTRCFQVACLLGDFFFFSSKQSS